MPCEAFFRSVGLFLFVLVWDICARRFQGLRAFFVALRWCFRLPFVFVCLRFVFGCLNGAKIARFRRFLVFMVYFIGRLFVRLVGGLFWL